MRLEVDAGTEGRLSSSCKRVLAPWPSLEVRLRDHLGKDQGVEWFLPVDPASRLESMSNNAKQHEMTY